MHLRLFDESLDAREQQPLARESGFTLCANREPLRIIMKSTTTPLAALLWLPLLLVLSSTAMAQEPTSEELWRRQPPPFKAHADGVAAPPRAGAAMDLRVSGVAWMQAPLAPNPQRMAALEKAASHAASRLASVGLRAPRITRRDGVYPLYFVRDLGGAAAQHGNGYGQFGVAEALRYRKR